MLPKNRLRQKRLDRLLIFPDHEIGEAYEGNLLKDYEEEFGQTFKKSSRGKKAEEETSL